MIEILRVSVIDTNLENHYSRILNVFSPIDAKKKGF
jgi:hypothetical protein